MLGGLAEPMYFLQIVGVSSQSMLGALFTQRARRADVFDCLSMSAHEYGGRCSNEGLAEPMNRVRPASASESLSGRVIRSAG